MNLNLSTLFSAQYLPYVLPGLIVLATGLIVTLLMISKRGNGLGLKLPKGKDKKSSQSFLDEAASAADRRTSVRREGPPVEVTVTSPGFKAGTNHGYVLDRSTGGLRLALASGMAPGSSIQVRAKNAPETTPWVTVIVRNCKDTGEHFELGCEFDKTPPWNVLLLFG
jgi:PilZ domain